ncbi:hypothetical protein FANTH_13508 [Fusarium anthophilum]|uniref:Rieske domain-containing protein n=1 Tax=Fusarium anthophilum TaxID=48485 RepID=A0A8H4YNH8_9HYPO|nr:hypothetical protein FANTH_13508 [Fusarium anthophilum]
MLGIECEYRKLPAYEVSQYSPKDTKEHEDEMNDPLRGWDGAIDQRGGLIIKDQATFHPTKYLNDILNWLMTQPNFRCFDETRVMSVEEKGIEILGIGNKSVNVSTADGYTVKCSNAVEATCVPLQKLSFIAQMEFMRSYCIAARVPKGAIEDCLLYDQAEEYKYIRMTACDDEHDYLVVGGCDHKVGQEDTTTEFGELEKWTRERFSQVKSVDYRWSGQIFEPVDFMQFIGKNQGNDHIYIITGDSRDDVYSPKRIASMVKSLPSMIAHDVQINAQYKRFLQSDITDIEDLGRGMGGVLNKTGSKPIAVYKDEEGNLKQYSALCPHMKGVVCWNTAEKSFDCPVHGSRFSREGICVMGPSKGNLDPVDEAGKADQENVAGS